MKKILLIILLVVVCVGIIGGGTVGILRLTDSSKLDQKTISSMKFSVGGLDSNGKYMNTNASIYTKEAFECQGLNVNLSFDNEVEYQIYFYDQNNDFVHTTGKLSGAFVKDSVPFFAKYARIVVTPKNDDVVSKLEVLSYAKQLTVKVNREQGFKNFTNNLFVTAEKGLKMLATTGEITTSETEYMISDYINVAQYKEALLFRADSSVMSAGYLCLYDSTKTFVGSVEIAKQSSVAFTTSEGVAYYLLPLKGLKVNDKEVTFTFIRMHTPTVNPVQIFCR